MRGRKQGEGTRIEREDKGQPEVLLGAVKRDEEHDPIRIKKQTKEQHVEFVHRLPKKWSELTFRLAQHHGEHGDL